MPRLSVQQTPEVTLAIDAAVTAGLAAANAPHSRKAEAWIRFGYEKWLEEQARAEKIAAYRELGADTERRDAIRTAAERAAAAGNL
jgi:hypothetical protein